MSKQSTLIRSLLIVWALPNTMVGMAVGFWGVARGGHVQKIDGCLEFHGPFVKWLLEKAPIGAGGALALTLGHTILGQTQYALDITRDHEHVHVRQYEKWGPFFLPAYFGSSILVWLRGGDLYRDNIFEKEAYRIADPQQES